MSNVKSASWLISVTCRLFLGLLILLLIGLVTVYLIPKSSYCLPIVVIVSGMVGGFVGLQRRLTKLASTELELFAKSWVYACLPSLIGGILALLLYILFLSGLLAGDLFPKFIANENSEKIIGMVSIFHQHATDYREYAKLIFWCFIAGFSERFVTDIISHFEVTSLKTIP